MNSTLFDTIADYIIRTVQNESILSGFQYIVDFSDICKVFEIKLTSYTIKQIEYSLNCREEVADVQTDTDGFDVVLFTDYAPNYEPSEYI